MKIKVKVTKEILEKSKMCSGYDVTANCAIALAVRDIFPQALVYGYWIELNRHVNLAFTNEVSRFVFLFDHSTPEERVLMSPISFEIDVPNEVIDSIGIGQVYKILSESKTLEHVN